MNKIFLVLSIFLIITAFALALNFYSADVNTVNEEDMVDLSNPENLILPPGEELPPIFNKTNTTGNSTNIKISSFFPLLSTVGIEIDSETPNTTASGYMIIKSDRGDPARVKVGETWNLWPETFGSGFTPVCSAWDWNGDNLYDMFFGSEYYVGWPWNIKWAKRCYDLTTNKAPNAQWDGNKAWNNRNLMDTSRVASGYVFAAVGAKTWRQHPDLWFWDYIYYEIKPQIECYKESDCGADGFIGNNYCSPSVGDDSDVYRTYRNYSCLNPGTSSAKCVSVDTKKEIQNCGDTTYGPWGSNYCSDDKTVSQSRTINKRGCGSDVKCYSRQETETKTIETCSADYTCQSGVCRPPIIQQIVNNGNSTAKIDYVFVPDESYNIESGVNFNKNNFNEFKGDVNKLIDNLFSINQLNKSKNRFNFYIASKQGKYGGVWNFSIPDIVKQKSTFADIYVIVHKTYIRDSAAACDSKMCFSNSMVSGNQKYLIIHESSHAFAGLADAYCCDGGYFETRVFPNLWRSKDRCDSDVNNNSWSEGCESFTSDSGGIWWRLNVIDIMSTSNQNSNHFYNNASFRRVNWSLSCFYPTDCSKTAADCSELHLNNYCATGRGSNSFGTATSVIKMFLSFNGNNISLKDSEIENDYFSENYIQQSEIIIDLISTKKQSLGKFGILDPRRAMSAEDNWLLSSESIDFKLDIPFLKDLKILKFADEKVLGEIDLSRQLYDFCIQNQDLYVCQNRDTDDDSFIDKEDCDPFNPRIYPGAPPEASDDYRLNGIWTNQDQIIKINATDMSCRKTGIREVRYCIGINCTPNIILNKPYELVFDKEGDFIVRYQAFSNEDKSSEISEVNIKIDKTPPETNLAIYKEKNQPVALPLYNESVFVSGLLTFELISEDKGVVPSGLNFVRYRIDSGSWITYNQTFNLSSLDEGYHYIEYQASDNANNLENMKSLKLILDKSPPITTYNYTPPVIPSNDTKYTIRVSMFVDDQGLIPSGVNSSAYRINNESWVYYDKFTKFYIISDACKNIVYYKSDDYGYNQEEGFFEININRSIVNNGCR